MPFRETLTITGLFAKVISHFSLDRCSKINEMSKTHLVPPSLRCAPRSKNLITVKCLFRGQSRVICSSNMLWAPFPFCLASLSLCHHTNNSSSHGACAGLTAQREQHPTLLNAEVGKERRQCPLPAVILQLNEEPHGLGSTEAALRNTLWRQLLTSHPQSALPLSQGLSYLRKQEAECGRAQLSSVL